MKKSTTNLCMLPNPGKNCRSALRLLIGTHRSVKKIASLSPFFLNKCQDSLCCEELLRYSGRVAGRGDVSEGVNCVQSYGRFGVRDGIVAAVQLYVERNRKAGICFFSLLIRYVRLLGSPPEEAR